MPCISPLTITVKSRGSVGKSFFNVPCRQCMCCRLKKVQSLRMMSDLYLYDVKKSYYLQFPEDYARNNQAQGI